MILAPIWCRWICFQWKLSNAQRKSVFFAIRNSITFRLTWKWWSKYNTECSYTHATLIEIRCSDSLIHILFLTFVHLTLKFNSFWLCCIGLNTQLTCDLAQSMRLVWQVWVCVFARIKIRVLSLHTMLVCLSHPHTFTFFNRIVASLSANFMECECHGVQLLISTLFWCQRSPDSQHTVNSFTSFKLNSPRQLFQQAKIPN